MIQAMLYDRDSGEVRIGGEELVGRWRDAPETFLWIDVQDVPAETERTLMVETFGIHPLAAQDALRVRHPPKVEHFEEVLFLLLRGLDDQTTDIHFGVMQIALFIAPRFLYSRRAGVSVSIDGTWAEVEADPGALGAGADAVALRIVNRIVRRYVPILINLEPRLEEIERAIFADPKDSLLAELTRYQSNLKKLRRTCTYHEQVFGGLRRQHPELIDEGLVHELIDIHEQLERALSLTNLLHELATDLIDAYLAISSHRLNQVMKVLTIFTVIFVPLGFLAGIYGMNFENIPELKFEYGYFVLLGVMVTIVAGLLIVFWRRRWIGR